MLDLCYVPGLKMYAVANLLPTTLARCSTAAAAAALRFKVVGVDVSHHRIDLSQSIVTKYHVDPRTCGQLSSLPRNGGGKKSGKEREDREIGIAARW